MSIPDYQSLMLPALRVLGDGDEHSPQEVITRLADEFHLTETERKQLLPSGRTPVINNRVHWAVTYMQHAGLLEKPRRAVWRVSAEGQKLLADHPAALDVGYLKRYPGFAAWHKGDVGEGLRVSAAPASAETHEPETPEEALERIWGAIRGQVANDLLESVKAGTSQFFERVVVQLLVAMGYGGSYAEAAQVIGRAGDGGIDGLIKEDRLGLDTVFVQAKKWEGSVGRPEIQKFAGSLEGERSRKGVFITTSSFSAEARDYVKKIDKRIALIDGPTLANLMIEHGVGVTTDREYAIPKVDPDFFDEA
jgi:restriction system protein